MLLIAGETADLLKNRASTLPTLLRLARCVMRFASAATSVRFARRCVLSRDPGVVYNVRVLPSAGAIIKIKEASTRYIIFLKSNSCKNAHVSNGRWWEAERSRELLAQILCIERTNIGARSE